MTAYQNCKVTDVMPVTLPSGVAGRAAPSASAARTSDLSSRCRSRRGKTPNRPSRGRECHPIRPKEDGRTTGHPSPPSDSAGGGPEQSGDPWFGWLARLHVCPSPSAPNVCLAPSGAGHFCLQGSQFSEGTEKSIVTAITDLIEDSIQTRVDAPATIKDAGIQRDVRWRQNI